MAASLHLPDVESLTPEQILALVLEQFPGRVALACSFQKEETVLLDMLFALEPKARVFAIDTHHLFPRRTRTGARSSSATARRSRSSKARRRRSRGGHGERSGRRSPISISRSRRSRRSSARSASSTPGSPGSAATSRRRARDAPKLGWDEQHELWKANPLADWSDDRVLGLHPRARAAVQPAARPRLRLDRRHALDAAGRRPFGPLGRHREDRVRHPHGAPRRRRRP